MATVMLTDPQVEKRITFVWRKHEGGKWRIVEINYQDVRSIIENKFIN